MAAVDPYQRNGIPPSPTDRRDQFAQLLATKVEQGYDVESQGDTEAVIVIRGRRRFRSQTVGKRQRIAIDEQGRATTHGLERRAEAPEVGGGSSAGSE
jgi:hypothetical protein